MHNLLPPPALSSLGTGTFVSISSTGKDSYVLYTKTKLQVVNCVEQNQITELGEK